MGKFIYLEKEVAENTKFKPVMNAYQENRLTIVFFPRDNVYYFEKAEDVSPQTIGVIKKTIDKLYPGAKEIS